MKKLFLTGLFMIVCFALSHAIPAAAPTIAGDKYVQSTKNFPAKSAGFDTLVGVDSTTLATQITVPAGSAYVLQRGPITGTGSDSVAMQVVVDSYDNSGVFLQRTVVDTFATSAGEQVAIPFFDTIFGEKFTFKLVSYTGNGGQVILPAMKFYIRRVYTETKPVLLGN
jgi:hypothetical protein